MDYTITTAVDYDYFIFLKAFANSLRNNSSDANLLVRCINFCPNEPVFRHKNFNNTKFYIDEREFKDKREKESYSMNVEFKTTLHALRSCTTDYVIFSDVDILVKKDLSLLLSRLDCDLAFTYDDDNRNVATSLLIIKNNDTMKAFYKLVDEKADEKKLETNFGDQQFFTNLLLQNAHIKTQVLPQTFCDVDCGEDEILWNGRGWRKFSHPIYRKEFLKYLNLR